MKVNRKSTPKMVVRTHSETNYQRFERHQIRRERMLFTSLLMALWLVVMLVWTWMR